MRPRPDRIAALACAAGKATIPDMRATPAAAFSAGGEDPFASVNQQAAALGLSDCAGDPGEG